VSCIKTLILADESPGRGSPLKWVFLDLAGNAAFNGQKYDEAVLHYSAALDAKATDAEFNAVLYCNRATVQSALLK
jgi:hypothetical protein